VNKRDRQCDKNNRQVGISRPAENIKDQSKTRQDLLWTKVTGNATKRTGKQDQQRTSRTNLKPGKTYCEQTWPGMQQKEPASWLFKTSRDHQRPIYALSITIVNNRDWQRDEKNLQVLTFWFVAVSGHWSGNIQK
jgi:hypothetical protein